MTWGWLMSVQFNYQVGGSFLPPGGLKQALSTKKFLKQFNKTVTPVVERRIDRVLRTPAPPRSDAKFVWSLSGSRNIRARRWWFWAVASGQVPTDGKHYKRSGAIPGGWQSFIRIVGGDILFSLLNPVPGAEHVYGSPEQTQSPGHSQTGWPNFLRSIAQIAEGLEQDLGEAWFIFSKKALRPRKRRKKK